MNYIFFFFTVSIIFLQEGSVSVPRCCCGTNWSKEAEEETIRERVCEW